MTKTVDGMTSAERLDTGPISRLRAGPQRDFGVSIIDESMDGRTLTITLEKDDLDGRAMGGSGNAQA